jgi:putative transposase
MRTSCRSWSTAIRSGSERSRTSRWPDRGRAAWCSGRDRYIEKASPWENGYVESFNGKLRDELLNGEVFNTLRKAQVLIEEWRHHYNRVRPHSALGYRPPAPETVPLARSKIGSGTGAAAMAH